MEEIVAKKLISLAEKHHQNSSGKMISTIENYVRENTIELKIANKFKDVNPELYSSWLTLSANLTDIYECYRKMTDNLYTKAIEFAKSVSQNEEELIKSLHDINNKAIDISERLKNI